MSNPYSPPEAEIQVPHAVYDADLVARAKLEVKSPAGLVILGGVISIILSGAFAIYFAFAASTMELGAGALSAGTFVVQALVSAWTLYAAIGALGAKRWGIALSGAIAGMIPCSSCWPLVIPASIWLLVVLIREHVKRGFQANSAMPI